MRLLTEGFECYVAYANDVRSRIGWVEKSIFHAVTLALFINFCISFYLSSSAALPIIAFDVLGLLYVFFFIAWIVAASRVNPAPEATPLRTDTSVDPASFRERLEEALRNAITDNDEAIPPAEVFDIILCAGEEIQRLPRQLPGLLADPRPEDPQEAKLYDQAKAAWAKLDEHVFEATVKSLTAFISRLPRFHPAPFSKPIVPTASLIYDVVQPFREGILKDDGQISGALQGQRRGLHQVRAEGGRDHPAAAL